LKVQETVSKRTLDCVPCMTAENRIPPARPTSEWALRERQHDLAWIGENLEIFMMATMAAFDEIGRGAIVVDTTSQPVHGVGQPFGYVTQGEVEQAGDEEMKRLVREYEPPQELVVMFIKPFYRTSSYRLRAQRRDGEGATNEFS